MWNWLFGTHLHLWVELQWRNDSQDTHSYLCISHSLTVTAVKRLRKIIWEKLQGILKGSVPRHRSVSDTKVQRRRTLSHHPPFPKAHPRTVVVQSSAHPCPACMETCTGKAVFLPTLSGQVTSSPHPWWWGGEATPVWIHPVGVALSERSQWCILQHIT